MQDKPEYDLRNLTDPPLRGWKLALAVLLQGLLLGAILATLLVGLVWLFRTPTWRLWFFTTGVLAAMHAISMGTRYGAEALVPRWRRFRRERLGGGEALTLLDDPGYMLALLASALVLLGAFGAAAGLYADKGFEMVGFTLLALVWWFLGFGTGRLRCEAMFLAVATGVIGWHVLGYWLASVPSSRVMAAGAVGTVASVSADLVMAHYSKLSHEEVRRVFNIAAIPLGLVALLGWNLARGSW